MDAKRMKTYFDHRRHNHGCGMETIGGQAVIILLLLLLYVWFYTGV
jgi:hypothetical protein